MKLYLDGHSLGYEMQVLLYTFFPGEEIVWEEVKAGEKRACDSADYVYTRIKKHSNTEYSALVLVKLGGKKSMQGEKIFAEKNETGHALDRLCEYALGRAFYRAASKLTGLSPAWGILTGIRPVKLARAMLDSGLTPEETAAYYKKHYYTNGTKSDLCVKTALEEKKIIKLSKPNSASLYVSIPFCPSRCLYCSFISHDITKAAKLLPKYVELLCEEIKKTGEVIKELGLNIETVYFGGGTPTSLSAEQLRRVMNTISDSIDLKNLREYTVEAGRPDTITREKLSAILEGSGKRISINPQTLDDSILKTIGRNHTAKQVFEAFALARKAGIPSINMDLIAGLPGDTPEGFKNTLDGVFSLAPEAITVHTLAMKRASRLVTSGNGLYDARGKDVEKMLEYADSKLIEKGYLPYYLYRQRNTLGGFENVGFSKPGYEGLYNIYTMDETHTVIAVGAGGVTKMREPGGSLIDRVFNFKYPYEYISRFGEILDRKKKVIQFYENSSKNNRQRENKHK